MSIVITGGAGFVGSHLVDRLVDRGEHVVVFDNLSTGRLPNLERAMQTGSATFAYVDVAAPAADLNAALDKAADSPVTAIYHLASPASPEAYGSHPWETLAVNGLGTMSLIDVALERGARFIFASTSEVYGDPLEHPQSETYFGNVNPIGPRACYDEGKRFGEAAVATAISHRGLDGRIVRLFNCYGPRMDAADGRLIPSFFSAMRANEPLPIHGTGGQTRSLTYVDDIVAGIVLVADAPFETCTPINLGSEDERTVWEIAETFAAMVGRELVVDRLPARPEDPSRRRPAIALAQHYGWQPDTSLEEGLRRTWAWFLDEAMAFA